MIKVELSYNPFLKEVSIDVNGSPAKLEVFKKKTNTNPWAMEFIKELENKYNDKEYEINFKGITRDYEFLEDAIKEYKGKAKFELKGKDGCIHPKDQLEKLRDVFDEIQKTSPFESLKDDDMKNHFKKVTSDDFEIAVVATMSSGKSTLINAMLGKDLLPARNEATTAVITKIYDEDNAKSFKAKVKNHDGKVIKSYEFFTFKEMNEVNNQSNDENLKTKPASVEIWGDIVGVDSNSMRLVLIDTPGPNNSQNNNHKDLTYSLLHKEDKPMILYVFNATQMKSNDDNQLLSYVAKAMKESGRQSQERFIFVLNKVDEYDFEKEKSMEEIIEDVKDYLKKHEIYKPRIFPVSALMAKLIRQNLNGDEITGKEQRLLRNCEDFVKEESMHFEKYAPLSEYSKKEQDRILQESKGNTYKEALVHTGIVAIELAISEYISKYALPIKISKGVNSFKGKMQALDIEAQVREEIKDNEKEIERFSKHLSQIENLIKNGEKAKELDSKISNLSLESKFKDELGNLIKVFNSEVEKKLDSMTGEVEKHEAESKLNDIEVAVKENSREFKIKIENLLEKEIKEQAQSYVDEYQKYIKDLMGEVKFEASPSVILGDLSSIDTQDIVSKYEMKKDVEITIKIEVETIWWKPWTFIKYIFCHGKEKKETVETDMVNLESVKKDKILPEIQNLYQENRQLALKTAQDEAKRFKDFFRQELKKLDEKIQEKVKEQKEIFKDKAKFEQMLKINKTNLDWLNNIKTKLDDVLSVERRTNA